MERDLSLADAEVEVRLGYSGCLRAAFGLCADGKLLSPPLMLALILDGLGAI